jgi:putative hydrolase of the HAD superfamily
MPAPKVILFDAANTLMHKPQLWEKMLEVLHPILPNLSVNDLIFKHKLVSELTDFPDKTNADFYREFNQRLLYTLGIIPNEAILENLFKKCSYLPWERFEDTSVLSNLNTPLAILSNFSGKLSVHVEQLFEPGTFSQIIISENENYRKPDPKFYKIAIEKLNLQPNEILYIGDSIKLDMEPAITCGMQVRLIDRENIYPDFPFRISSLLELNHSSHA